MLFSKDQDFTDALDSPEALEARLIVLERDRKRYRRFAGFFAFVFFVNYFASFYAIHEGQQPGVAVLVGPLMALLGLLQLAVAASAQSDIRTLLAMKKLLGFNDRMP